jgi:hypothetical protein
MSIEHERMMQRTSDGVKGKIEQAMVWEEERASEAEKRRKWRVWREDEKGSCSQR